MSHNADVTVIDHSAGFLVYRFGEALEFLGVFSRKHQEWGFPKGHLERGETVLDAARRELEEEVSIIDIAIDGGYRETVFYPIMKKGHRIVKRVDFFLARTLGQEPCVSREIERIEWFEASSISLGPFYPLQKYLIRKAMLYLLS